MCMRSSRINLAFVSRQHFFFNVKQLFLLCNKYNNDSAPKNIPNVLVGVCALWGEGGGYVFFSFCDWLLPITTVSL